MKYLALLVTLSATPLTAQQTLCADRDTMLEALQSKYAESLQSFALDSGGNLTDFYVNPETGTWTVTRTAPDGQSCIVAHGQNWTDIQSSEST